MGTESDMPWEIGLGIMDQKKIWVSKTIGVPKYVGTQIYCESKRLGPEKIGEVYT